MSRFIVLFAFFSLIIGGPAFAQDKTDTEIIKQNVINMWAAQEARDVPAYLTYIHDDYTVFGEGDVYIQAGKAKEKASYEDYLGRVTGLKTFMHQPEVHVRGNTAWITYYWSDSGYSTTRGTNGQRIKGERFTSTGKSTRIFVKENGIWLNIHSHFTQVE